MKRLPVTIGTLLFFISACVGTRTVKMDPLDYQSKAGDLGRKYRYTAKTAVVTIRTSGYGGKINSGLRHVN